MIGGLLASNSSAASRRGDGRRDTGRRRRRAKTGGTLREGYDLDFSRMDPINTSWYDPGFFALYEAAITLDQKARFVPQLATGWSTKNNGKTWTLKIKKGSKFHSGAPVTAASVAAVFFGDHQPEVGEARGSPRAATGEEGRREGSADGRDHGSSIRTRTCRT